jgi:hypothetical protein
MSVEHSWNYTDSGKPPSASRNSPPSGPGPPHCRGFTITFRHTTHSVGVLWRSDQPDAETSTWQHTTLTRGRHPCPRAGFEPAIPTSERPQTHALDGAATGICRALVSSLNYCSTLTSIECRILHSCRFDIVITTTTTTTIIITSEWKGNWGRVWVDDNY